MIEDPMSLANVEKEKGYPSRHQKKEGIVDMFRRTKGTTKSKEKISCHKSIMSHLLVINQGIVVEIQELYN